MRQDEVDDEDDDLEDADEAETEEEPQESPGVPDERKGRRLLIVFDPEGVFRSYADFSKILIHPKYSSESSKPIDQNKIQFIKNYDLRGISLLEGELYT